MVKLAPRTRMRFVKEAVASRVAARVFAKMSAYYVFKFFVQPGDKIATHTIVHGLFEKYEIECLRVLCSDHIRKRMVGRRAVGLDVGANIGAYAVALSDLFSRVFAFEPNPVTFRVLEANVVLNCIYNVTCVEVALGDSEEFADLYNVEDWNNGMASLAPGKAGHKLISKVRVRRGDAVVAPILGDDEAVAFIKLDVEGYEDRAIAGLVETIRRYRPLIAFEGRDRDVIFRVVSLLRECGYHHFYWIERRKKVSASRARRVFELIVNGADYHLQPVVEFGDGFYSSIVASVDGLEESSR